MSHSLDDPSDQILHFCSGVLIDEKARSNNNITTLKFCLHEQNDYRVHFKYWTSEKLPPISSRKWTPWKWFPQNLGNKYNKEHSKVSPSDLEIWFSKGVNSKQEVNV